MSDRHQDEQLASGLLAEEARGRGAGLASDALVHKLVEQEMSRERQVRRVAIASWSVVFLSVVLFGAARPMAPFGVLGRVAFGVENAAPFLGFAALILAVLSTGAWLFRPRALPLAVIERRLAELEDLLRRGG